MTLRACPDPRFVIHRCDICGTERRENRRWERPLGWAAALSAGGGVVDLCARCARVPEPEGVA